MIKGINNGSAVCVEKEMNAKMPMMGCHHHYIERLEDAAAREAYGPSTAPEEGFAKRFKSWFNGSTEKTCENVMI